jgi:uncharacterized protein YggT (Ycf19 family)
MEILLTAVLLILEVLYWMIIIDVIVSYIPSISRHPLVIALRRVTGVVLNPIRRSIGARRVGDAYIDFSPLIALIVIWIVRVVISGVIRGM